MIILDTHIWLWWLSGNSKLSKKQKHQIESAGRIGVSAISLFEVAWLVNHKRIELPCPLRDWFTMALDESDIEIVPISVDIACLANSLPEHHSDPQDRLIIATAIDNKALLLSSDTKFKLYVELDNLLI